MFPGRGEAASIEREPDFILSDERSSIGRDFHPKDEQAFGWLVQVFWVIEKRKAHLISSSWVDKMVDKIGLLYQ